MNKQDASRLFGRLRGALLALDEVLGEVIEHRAWEPLGYSSFAEAWAQQLGDMRLSGRLAATVAYAMFDTGSTPEQVSAAVHGLGPVKVKALHQGYVRGLDSGQAARLAAKSERRSPRRVDVPARTIELDEGETYIGGYVRKPGVKRNSVTLDGFTDDEIAAWKQYAEEAGADYREWLRDVLREAANQQIEETEAAA